MHFSGWLRGVSPRDFSFREQQESKITPREATSVGINRCSCKKVSPFKSFQTLKKVTGFSSDFTKICPSVTSRVPGGRPEREREEPSAPCCPLTRASDTIYKAAFPFWRGLEGLWVWDPSTAIPDSTALLFQLREPGDLHPGKMAHASFYSPLCPCVPRDTSQRCSPCHRLSCLAGCPPGLLRTWSAKAAMQPSHPFPPGVLPPPPRDSVYAEL